MRKSRFWRYDYNTVRPQLSLGNQTPLQVCRTLEQFGVTVLDLSEIDVNGSNHSKFADSPEIVQLIGKRLSVDGVGTRNGSDPLLSSVLMLPITVTAATLAG